MGSSFADDPQRDTHNCSRFAPVVEKLSSVRSFPCFCADVPTHFLFFVMNVTYGKLLRYE